MYTFLWALLIGVFGLGVVLNYFGLLRKIKVQEQVMGPYIMVYEEHTGDYSASAQVMDRVYRRLKSQAQLETSRGFGVYYDDPKQVKKSALRWRAGCLLEPNQVHSAEALKADFLLTTFPETECLVAKFPFKGMPSAILGALKVYPAFRAYRKQKGYTEMPAIEIYEENRRIVYLMPIKRIKV